MGRGRDPQLPPQLPPGLTTAVSDPASQRLLEFSTFSSSRSLGRAPSGRRADGYRFLVLKRCELIYDKAAYQLCTERWRDVVNISSFNHAKGSLLLLLSNAKGSRGKSSTGLDLSTEIELRRKYGVSNVIGN